MDSSSLSSRSGQGTLEFVFVLLALFAGIFFLADVVKIGYCWGGVQYATSRGIRTIKMLPNETPANVKEANIKNEILRMTGILGIALNLGDIAVQVTDDSITVETAKRIVLSRLSAILISFGGDRSGSYDVRVKEVVRNESL